MTAATVPGGDGTASNERFDDETARRWFETLLEMRRMAEARPEEAKRAAEFAAHAAGLLSRGVLGWAAEALGLLYSDDEPRRPPVEEARDVIATTVRLGLPVMQPSAKYALASALVALNAGQVDPLLRPSQPGRRGVRPFDTAVAELRMLMWVRWQHGLGRRVGHAEADLLRELNAPPAAILTLDAIKKWRTELPKIFGEEYVARALDRAERLGRVEAAKQAGVPEAEAASFGDDPEGLFWAASNTPQSLDAVKALRRRGKGWDR
jgi:hypothetical protein